MATKYYANRVWVNLQTGEFISHDARQTMNSSPHIQLFDSHGEAHRYQELILLQRAGLIRDLLTQQKFILQPKFSLLYKETVAAITMIVDFKYFDLVDNIIVIEDFKGFRTAVYKLKWKMLKHLFCEEIIAGNIRLYESER